MYTYVLFFRITTILVSQFLIDLQQVKTSTAGIGSNTSPTQSQSIIFNRDVGSIGSSISGPLDHAEQEEADETLEVSYFLQIYTISSSHTLQTLNEEN